MGAVSMSCVFRLRMGGRPTYLKQGRQRRGGVGLDAVEWGLCVVNLDTAHPDSILSYGFWFYSEVIYHFGHHLYAKYIRYVIENTIGQEKIPEA